MEFDHNSTWVYVIFDFQIVWGEPISISGILSMLLISVWSSRVFGALSSCYILLLRNLEKTHIDYWALIQFLVLSISLFLYILY